jgi:hypothetical protein
LPPGKLLKDLKLLAGRAEALRLRRLNLRSVKDAVVKVDVGRKRAVQPLEMLASGLKLQADYG